MSPLSDQPLDPALTDKRIRTVELVISTILRVGVISSLALVVFGLSVMFLQHPHSLNSAESYQALTSTHAAYPHTIGDVFLGVGSFQGEAIIGLGLLMLIATPVMRVAVSIFAFIVHRDKVFTAITTLVLLLLFLSFVLGAIE